VIRTARCGPGRPPPAFGVVAWITFALYPLRSRRFRKASADSRVFIAPACSMNFAPPEGVATGAFSFFLPIGSGEGSFRESASGKVASASVFFQIVPAVGGSRREEPPPGSSPPPPNTPTSPSGSPRRWKSARLSPPPAPGATFSPPPSPRLSRRISQLEAEKKGDRDHDEDAHDEEGELVVIGIRASKPEFVTERSHIRSGAVTPIRESPEATTVFTPRASARRACVRSGDSPRNRC